MKDNKIFCILGKFATGKTTIAKILQEKYNLQRIITCTTRLKREGEVDGIDYHFLSDEKFEELASNNKMVAINRVPYINNTIGISKLIELISNPTKNDTDLNTLFNTESSPRFSKKYGVSLDTIDLQNNSYVIVLEPSGYYDLINKLGKEKIKSIYIKLNDKERFLRALNREVQPNCTDIALKQLEELSAFDSLENNCDKLIDNSNSLENTLIEIYEYISTP